MSGRKGMKQYPEWIKQQVKERVLAGESQCQLSKELGISRYSIQSQCGLRPKTKLRQIAPLRKGRPKVNKTIEDYKKRKQEIADGSGTNAGFSAVCGKDVRPKVKYAVIYRHRSEHSVFVMCKFFGLS